MSDEEDDSIAMAMTACGQTVYWRCKRCLVDHPSPRYPCHNCHVERGLDVTSHHQLLLTRHFPGQQPKVSTAHTECYCLPSDSEEEASEARETLPPVVEPTLPPQPDLQPQPSEAAPVKAAEEEQVVEKHTTTNEEEERELRTQFLIAKCIHDADDDASDFEDLLPKSAPLPPIFTETELSPPVAAVLPTTDIRHESTGGDDFDFLQLDLVEDATTLTPEPAAQVTPPSLAPSDVQAEKDIAEVTQSAALVVEQQLVGSKAQPAEECSLSQPSEFFKQIMAIDVQAYVASLHAPSVIALLKTKQAEAAVIAHTSRWLPVLRNLNPPPQARILACQDLIVDSTVTLPSSLPTASVLATPTSTHTPVVAATAAPTIKPVNRTWAAKTVPTTKRATPASSLKSPPPAKKQRAPVAEEDEIEIRAVPRIDGHDELCFACSKPSGKKIGPLLLCDAPECPRVYHRSCAGLKRMPEEDEDWFCIGCCRSCKAPARQ
jgi:hypothetical protein